MCESLYLAVLLKVCLGGSVCHPRNLISYCTFICVTARFKNIKRHNNPLYITCIAWKSNLSKYKISMVCWAFVCPVLLDDSVVVFCCFTAMNKEDNFLCVDPLNSSFVCPRHVYLTDFAHRKAVVSPINISVCECNIFFKLFLLAVKTATRTPGPFIARTSCIHSLIRMARARCASRTARKQ